MPIITNINLPIYMSIASVNQNQKLYFNNEENELELENALPKIILDIKK